MRIYFKVKKVTVIRKMIMTKFFLYKRVYFKVKIVTVKMLWVSETGRDIAFSLLYILFIARVWPKYSMESGQEKWNECNE